MPHDTFRHPERLQVRLEDRQALFPPRTREDLPKVKRLPVSIRIVLESVLRNCDGKKITEQHLKQLANWGPKAKRMDEIPFVVARVVLQDFTGVPLLADLAAMRNVAEQDGQESQDDRAPGAGGSRRRPFGHDRLITARRMRSI